MGLLSVYLIKKELFNGETESITMKFQQKYITECTEVTTPEHYLWVSVLSKAAHDAVYGSDWREAKIAIAWFKGMGSGFKEVCSFAGKDPLYVHKRMIKAILKRETDMEMRRNGGRYYVKETRQPVPHFHSHYRGGLKRGPYNTQPKRKVGRPRTKNSKYVIMGRKGGRPKLYGV